MSSFSIDLDQVKRLPDNLSVGGILILLREYRSSQNFDPHSPIYQEILRHALATGVDVLSEVSSPIMRPGMAECCFIYNHMPFRLAYSV